MEHADNCRECYEWVVSLSPGVERVPREEEYPHESGQTHEYRLAEDTSTTKAVCDSGTPTEEMRELAAASHSRPPPHVP